MGVTNTLVRSLERCVIAGGGVPDSKVMGRRWHSDNHGDHSWLEELEAEVAPPHEQTKICSYDDDVSTVAQKRGQKEKTEQDVWLTCPCSMFYTSVQLYE